MPAVLRNITPNEFFQPIAEALRRSVSVTITQSGDYTRLTGTFTYVGIKNKVEVIAGDLNGSYRIVKMGFDKEWIEIEYSGAFDSTGTVNTFPYFIWGNLNKIRTYMNSTQEYPVLAMVLPDLYNVNTDPRDMEFINDVFKFFFINNFTSPVDEQTHETQRIFDDTVNEMSALSLEFMTLVRANEDIIDITDIRRSEQIPFGVTIRDNESGKTSSVFDYSNAGCYVEMRVRIDKLYNC